MGNGVSVPIFPLFAKTIDLMVNRHGGEYTAAGFDREKGGNADANRQGFEPAGARDRRQQNLEFLTRIMECP